MVSKPCLSPKWLVPLTRACTCGNHARWLRNPRHPPIPIKNASRVLTYSKLYTVGQWDGPGANNPWISKNIFPGAYEVLRTSA
jgi:hypothetical protein